MNNKRFLFIVCLFLCSIETFSQLPKFHTIIFSASDDEKISGCVANNTQSILLLATNIATTLNYEMAPTIIMEGSDFSTENLENTIISLNCQTTDIVVFYFTGHSASLAGDSSTLAKLQFGYSPDAENIYSIKAIQERISQKMPKLCLVLADICDSISESVKIPTIVEQQSNITQSSVNNFKALFADTKGSIIATSCKSGETATASNLGGVFTASFMQAINTASQSKSIVGWSAVLNDSKKQTIDNVNQTPQFIISIAGAVTSLPVSKSTNAISTDLVGALVDLSNNNKSDDDRFAAYKPVQTRFFAPKAIVQVYGKDGKTCLGQYNAEKYLMNLAISYNIVNFTILSQKENTDKKITVLKIHEIYKSIK